MNIQTYSRFLESVERFLKPKNVLVLNLFQPYSFELDIPNARVINTLHDIVSIKDTKFELILGVMPFHWYPEVILDTPSKLKVPTNWKLIYDSLKILTSKGKALFLIEPNILTSKQGKRFLQDLSDQGFYNNSILELPDRNFISRIAFQPIVMEFEKTKIESLFISELSDNFEELIPSIFNPKNTNNLASGLCVDRSRFESFNKFRVESEINNLKTQYKEYTQYKLSDVSYEINATKDSFKDKSNSIYIPNIGNSAVLSSIEKTTMKHQNYFQIVLNNEIVLSEYLALFFRSEFGKRILKYATNSNFIPKINKSEIINIAIPIPSLIEQNLIILTDKKLLELQDTIGKLAAELSLNPKNSQIILDKFENLQKPFKELTIEEEILNLIRKGENKHIEFKESFSKNLETGQKDKVIEKSALKTIVGFLNADGGTLLIGISDKGEIKGIENDFFKNADDYKKRFKDILKTKIGAEFYPQIEYDLYSVLGKLILKVNCNPSDEPCFYDEIEFYVRTNPATDRLEGRKQADYIKVRFNNDNKKGSKI